MKRPFPRPSPIRPPRPLIWGSTLLGSGPGCPVPPELSSWGGLCPPRLVLCAYPSRSWLVVLALARRWTRTGLQWEQGGPTQVVSRKRLCDAGQDRGELGQ